MIACEIAALVEQYRSSPEEPGAGDGRSQEGATARRRAARRLYNRLHLRQPDDSDAAGATGYDDWPVATWELLRGELGRHSRTEHGWVREPSGDENPGSEIVRRPDGLLVRRPRTRTADGGTDLSIEWPRLERTTPRGWIWFSGGADRADLGMRVYIGLAGDDRPARWVGLVRALLGEGIAFRTKILGEPRPSRPDNVVVYVHTSDLTRALDAVSRTVPPDARLDRTAGFGVPVAPSVSVAHPEGDEDPFGSLGMQRCEMAYDLLVGTTGTTVAAVPADRLSTLTRILELQQARVRSLVGTTT